MTNGNLLCVLAMLSHPPGCHHCP